jgi:GNAT superfamily N-acetyltransferase
VHRDGSGWLWIEVAAEGRRQGIGVALYERIAARLERLGAAPLHTQIDDEDGRAFAERRGFRKLGFAPTVLIEHYERA